MNSLFHQRQIRRFVELLVLTLCLPCVFTSSSRAAVSPDQAEHLIICPAAFVPQFEVLANHRTFVADLPSCVVTLEDVLTSAPAGRDDAETLRNYLIQQYALGHLRYVLLGGDSGVMPVRFARSAFNPYGGYTDLETDLYFACLDGDWDADGDSIFGEGYTTYDDPGDDVDLSPELAVGRAPVNSIAQAERFVQGVISYDTLNPAPHLASAAMLAEVLFPSDWDGTESINLDGATYAEDYVMALATHPSAPMITRIYENWSDYPGSQPLTTAAALSTLDSGTFGLLCFLGEGSLTSLPAGNGTFSITQIDALTNAPRFYFAISASNNSASFFDDCALEHLILAADGGCAGAIGFTELVLGTEFSQYTKEFLQQVAAGTGILVGDAMRSVLQHHAPSLPYETLWRWNNLTWCLLGDPATPFRTELLPIPAKATSLGGLKARFRRR